MNYKGLVNGKEITFKINSVAKRANGVLVQCGETIVLCTAVVGNKVTNGDYLPLNINYIERFSSINRIPGGYKKREGAPSDSEILKGRTVDKAIRPTIKDDFSNEIQIFVQVLSYDGYCPQVLGIAGASVALNLVGASSKLVSAARINNKNINISSKKSDFDFIQAMCNEKIVMAEFSSKKNENNQKTILKHQKNLALLARQINNIQEKIIQTNTTPKNEKSSICYSIFDISAKMHAKKIVKSLFSENCANDRVSASNKIRSNYLSRFDSDKFKNSNKLDFYVKEYFLKKSFELNLRTDNRKFDELRYFSFESNYLPSLHGSCLFSRGETQALVSLTIGEITNAQNMESLNGMYKDFLLVHYNFMPYSVGEAAKSTFTSRREVGHGELARNAIKSVLPERLESVVRVHSEITSSDGSSSMATVCAASIALAESDFGVSEHVAGVSIGAIAYKDKLEVIYDMNEVEDKFSMMDLKVAGTKDSIVAIQLDTKFGGISPELFAKGLESARSGLNIILEKLESYSKIKSKNYVYTKKIAIDSEGLKSLASENDMLLKGLSNKFGVEINISESEIIVSSKDQEKTTKAALAIIKLGEL